MPSNRTYVCPVCGVLKRYPLPQGIQSYAVHQENLRCLHIPEETIAQWIVIPPVHGHWRSWHYVLKDFSWPKWLEHCEQPLFLLGKRAAQAATRLSDIERIQWLKLGARITEHANKPYWRPITKFEKLNQRYPLV